jgi:hypothetical protein
MNPDVVQIMAGVARNFLTQIHIGREFKTEGAVPRLDADALVEPIRIVRNFQKLGSIRTQTPYVYIECVQTIFPVNGRATPLTPGSRFDYEVPDIYGRPWAKTWEEYYEKGMKKPEDPDFFTFK